MYLYILELLRQDLIAWCNENIRAAGKIGIRALNESSRASQGLGQLDSRLSLARLEIDSKLSSEPKAWSTRLEKVESISSQLEIIV